MQFFDRRQLELTPVTRRRCIIALIGRWRGLGCFGNLEKSNVIKDYIRRDSTDGRAAAVFSNLKRHGPEIESRFRSVDRMSFFQRLRFPMLQRAVKVIWCIKSIHNGRTTEKDQVYTGIDSHYFGQIHQVLIGYQLRSVKIALFC